MSPPLILTYAVSGSLLILAVTVRKPSWSCVFAFFAGAIALPTSFGQIVDGGVLAFGIGLLISVFAILFLAVNALSP